MELLPLVCLCLLSCSGDAVRVVVEEGSDAVLPCLISNKENLEGKLFDWRKDGSPRKTEVFMYEAGDHYNNGRDGQDQQFIGRVSFFQDQLQNGNASIKITGTKMADSGTYSCDFPNHQPRQTSIIELVVGAASEPYVTILDQTKDWSLLQCVVKGASPEPKVEWRDSSGNILPADEPEVVERGGRFYISLNITVTKTDKYLCVVTQEEIGHQIDSVIYVHINGAASEPSVIILDQTEDGLLLQCVVKGASPKPKVEWKDSSGNILPVKDLKETERGDSYDIVLQTTVTKTDRYRCVVTQEEINHHIHAETLVTLNGSNTGWIVGFVAGVLITLFVVAVVVSGLYIKHLRKENRKKDEEKREPQTEPNSSTSLKESS